jgi:hypothetical protein
MTHFAPGPGFALVVEVERGARPGDDFRPTVDVRSDEVLHRRSGRDRRRIAERQSKDAAQMLFELGRFRALDRPMTAVVDAGRDLVDDRAIGAGEIFNGQHANMV